MPKGKVKKAKIDGRSIYQVPELRLADFLSKLYDVNARVLFCQTRSGAISMSVYTEDDKETFYIEDAKDALAVFDQAAEFAVEAS